MSDPIDLKQLESLSCLKIDDAQKENMISSIQGVFQMLHSIDSVTVEKQPLAIQNPTPLAADKVDNTFTFNKNQNIKGIHLDSGLFLAPKVLSKD